MLAPRGGRPGCIGSHLCGACLKNEVRKRALRDADESPDEDALRIIAEANRKTADWMQAADAD